MQTLFYIETKNNCGVAVMQVPELSEPIFTVNLDASEMQNRKDLNNWYLTYGMRQVEIVSCIFPISESKIIEMAKSVLSGADIREEINIYEYLRSEEIAEAENDIAPNEYWEAQDSLSWS